MQILTYVMQNYITHACNVEDLYLQRIVRIVARKTMKHSDAINGEVWALETIPVHMRILAFVHTRYVDRTSAKCVNFKHNSKSIRILISQQNAKTDLFLFYVAGVATFSMIQFSTKHSHKQHAFVIRIS